MFSLTSGMDYYLYNQPTDMRKSFDSLSGIVVSEMGKQVTSGEVFIFINKPRNKVKLLHWEAGGFVLYYKRLEAGNFELPQIDKIKKTYRINWSDLVMIIEGISLKQTKKRPRYL